jgi:hypothetical protein
MECLPDRAPGQPPTLDRSRQPVTLTSMRRMKTACRDCRWCNPSYLARGLHPLGRRTSFGRECGACRHPMRKHADGDLSRPANGPAATQPISVGGQWAVCPTDPPGLLRWWDGNGWGGDTRPAHAPT